MKYKYINISGSVHLQQSTSSTVDCGKKLFFQDQFKIIDNVGSKVLNYKNICITNQAIDGDFRKWTGNSLDNYSITNLSLEKNTKYVLFDANSAKLIHTGTNGILYQDVQDGKGLDYWQNNKLISFNAYIKTAYSKLARIGISDGVSTDYSEYHSGNNCWENLKIQKLITSSATRIRIIVDIRLNNPISQNREVYVDGIMVNEGPYHINFTRNISEV